MNQSKRTAVVERLRDISFTALRITTGLILIAHGWQKLTDLNAWQEQLGNLGVGAPNVLAYFSIAGEFLAGLGLFVGFLTPLAAFGAACNMAAAIALVHAGSGLLAKDGGYEYPLTLLAACLLFVAHGGGAWSLDAVILRARRAIGEPRGVGMGGPTHWKEAHAGDRR